MIELTDSLELKLKSLRKTKVLEQVIDIFKTSKLPLSVEDIYTKITTDKKPALSTVYRIIDKLANMKIIHETIKDADKSRYELYNNPHKHYIVCTNCKTLFPLDFCPFHELEEKIEQQTGFIITGHKFEIYGECPKCHKKIQC